MEGSNFSNTPGLYCILRVQRTFLFRHLPAASHYMYVFYYKNLFPPLHTKMCNHFAIPGMKSTHCNHKHCLFILCNPTCRNIIYTCSLCHGDFTSHLPMYYRNWNLVCRLRVSGNSFNLKTSWFDKTIRTSFLFLDSVLLLQSKSLLL